MANVLKREKQERVIAALVEGSSVRSTERMTGVHRDTIIRLMKRVGAGCEVLMDRELRDLDCQRVQVDEIWGYVGKEATAGPARGQPKSRWRLLDLGGNRRRLEARSLLPCGEAPMQPRPKTS